MSHYTREKACLGGQFDEFTSREEFRTRGKNTPFLLDNQTKDRHNIGLKPPTIGGFLISTHSGERALPNGRTTHRIRGDQLATMMWH